MATLSAMVKPESAAGAPVTVKVRRTQVERRAHTRAALIDSAVACVNAVGAASVTTAQVAARAGVTRGAVQHHFRSPEELYLALVDHAWQEIVRTCEGAPGPDVPLARRIADWGATLVDAFTSPAALAGYEILMYYRGSAGFVAAHTPITLAAEQRLDDRWLAAFADTGLGTKRLVYVRHTARTFMLGAIARGLIVPGTDGDLRGEVVDLIRAFLPDRR